MRANSTRLYFLLITFCTYFTNPSLSQELDRTFLPKFDGAANVSSMVRLSDNSILITGNITSAEGKAANGIVKISENGSVDPAFNTSVKVTGHVWQAAEQQEGKLVFVGDFSVGSPISHRSIVRLNSDGSLDNTFTSPVVNGTIKGLLNLQDGKIIIGGSFRLAGKFSDQNIARLNPDGSLDNSFSYEDVPSGGITRLLLQSDGKIVVAGRFIPYDTPAHERIIRLNSNGSLDLSFSTSFKLREGEYITSLAPQQNGKLLFTTGQTHPSFSYPANDLFYGIGRLNSDGSLDQTFVNPFKSATSSGSTLHGYLNFIMLKGEKILVGGIIFDSSDPSAQSRLIVQLNADGTVDSNFVSPKQREGQAIFAVEGQNNTILVCGSIKRVSGQVFSGIIKLSGSGGLVADFLPDLRALPQINKLAVQPDGKVLISGNFSFVNDRRVQDIVRLGAKGKVDDTFTDYYVDASYEYLLRYPVISTQGEKILMRASILENGIPKEGVVRLNPNGTPDKSFTTLYNDYSAIGAIATQEDGKILVATTKVKRLLPDGTADPTFIQSELSSLFITSIAVQKNGKIIVSCYGNTPGSTRASSYLMQLNTDGSIDQTFNGFGFKYSLYTSSVINDVIIEPEGAILVAGYFNSYNDNSVRNGLIRLSTDGSFKDDVLVPYTTAGKIESLAISKEGGIVLGGTFTVEGIRQSVIHMSSTPLFLKKTQTKGAFVQISPNPTTEKAEVYFENNYRGTINLRMSDSFGRTVKNIELQKHEQNMQYQLNLSDLADGLYILTLSSGNAKEVKKIIKVSN